MAGARIRSAFWLPCVLLAVHQRKLEITSDCFSVIREPVPMRGLYSEIVNCWKASRNPSPRSMATAGPSQQIRSMSPKIRSNSGSERSPIVFKRCLSIAKTFSVFANTSAGADELLTITAVEEKPASMACVSHRGGRTERTWKRLQTCTHMQRGAK